MPSCIRATRSVHSYVIRSQLRTACALNRVSLRFATHAYLYTGQHDHESTRGPRATPAELLEEPQAEQGQYTSLTSKLNHYPTKQNEPAYQPTQATLSSLLSPSPSANHSSQRTFLAHSRRTGLNPTSTVFTGTRYEYLALSSLRRLGIELARVGGTGDRGVDLVGFWHLPQWSHAVMQPADGRTDEVDHSEKVREKIKVVIQCKRISPTARAARSIGPNVLRELEGAFRGAPVGWRAREGVLGVLVSTRAATKGVIEGMRRSERALAWVLLDEIKDVESNAAGRAEVESAEDDDGDYHVGRSEVEGDRGIGNGSEEADAEYTVVNGRIKQILWNQKARELGLDGLDVVKRYSSDEVVDLEDEVLLKWKGNAVEGLPIDEGRYPVRAPFQRR